MKQIILFLIIIPAFLNAQGWEKYYGNGSGNSVQQTNDGGFIITGFMELENPNKLFLIKTNQTGNILWSKTYTKRAYNVGHSVQQTTDGGYIIAGITWDDIYYPDLLLIRTNSIGDTLWVKTYGSIYSETGHSVKQTIDGGYVITGHYGTDLNQANVYLIKTDESGDSLWTNTITSNTNDIGYSIQLTSENDFIIGGTKNFDPGPSDMYLIKADEFGDTIWTKTFGGVENDVGISVNTTGDGGYILTGEYGTNSNHSNVYLVKTDENGDTLWSKTYGGQFSGRGNSVQQTQDGGYIISGYIEDQYSHNVYLIRTDNMGDTLWTKSFGSYGYDIGNSVKQTIDGGFIFTGFSNSSIFLIKTDSEGNLVSIIDIPIPKSNRKLIKTIDFSGKEISKPQKNQAYIEIYDDGTIQKKIIIK